MRPRFVKRVMKDGEVLMEFPPEVMKENICKHPKTIEMMQTILTHVVSQGLGKKAGSNNFKVAGKTGTAQIWNRYGNTAAYLLSFAGFFPADNPRYSCIVCIQKNGLPASGGGMSGVVFKQIAEGIMAQDVKLSVDDARDAKSVLLPDVKNGNLPAADYVLSHLGVKTRDGWSGSYANGNPVWGTATVKKNEVRLDKAKTYARNLVPDVTGMGAKDAVYMLESRGVRVRLTGRGKVTEQSLPAGHKITVGETCNLKLEI